MLSLMYVEGINYVDTPNFKTITDQDKYFDKCEVLGLSSADYFYPPFYNNEIIISEEDGITFKTKANYLYIEYEGKRYYYFIDRVSYENIGSITLRLTMDVIQTYMFDINFVNYKITKRLINRWNSDGTINRKYLRNNISNGTFVNETFKDYTIESNDYTNMFGWIVAKIQVSNNTPSQTIIYNTSLMTSKVRTTISEDTQLILVPSLCLKNSNISMNTLGNITFRFIQKTDNVEVSRYDRTFNQMELTIANLCERTDCVEMYYLNELPDIMSNYFSVSYSSTTNIFTITVNFNTNSNIYNTGCDLFTVSGSSASNFLWGIRVYSLDTIDNSKTIDLGYTENTTKGVSFNYKYVPQLIDENYIQVNFGERIKQAIFPLSVLTSSELYGCRKIDMFSGYRNYWLTEELYPEYIDKYNSAITCDTKELYTMWNDYWKQYMSGNQGTLSLGLAYKASKGLYYDSVTKNINPSFTSIAKRGATTDTLVDMAETITNLQMKPDSYKQGGNCTNDITFNSMNNVVYINVVSDIEDVAKELETWGYMVHETYSGKSLFTDMQTRYYYNYYKCEEMTLTLNVLGDNNTINRIEDRFRNGVRLWEVDNMSDLTLGQVCIYDNVEI